MPQFLNDLTKYKRFFSFGCSFTDYHWPTWSDLIGKRFGDQYYNFASTGCCNGAVFRSVIEADLLHKFQPDDLVVIQWTDIVRDEGWRPDTGLQGCGSLFQNHQYTIYTNEHFEKLDAREFLRRDLTYMRAMNAYLSLANVDVYMFTMNKIGNTEDRSLEKSEHIISMFKDTVNILGPSFEETVEWRKQQGVYVIASYGGTYDNHPSPIMHLNHLQKLFPNFVIDPEMVELAQTAEHRVRDIPLNGNEVVFDKKVPLRFLWKI